MTDHHNWPHEADQCEMTTVMALDSYGHGIIILELS